MYAIRPVSILDNTGKKVITISTGGLDTKINGEAQIGDGGEYLGRSSGAIINDGSIDCTMIVVGNISTQRWAEALEAGTSQKMTFNSIDGKLEVGDFFITGRSIKWDNKAGTISGSFQFEGGATRKV